MAEEIECELAIGDAIRVGEAIYTVIDIEYGEVSFRVDNAADEPIAFGPSLPPK